MVTNYQLSNFADDTQSMRISDNKENALEITTKEANSVTVFVSNNLVNNVNDTTVLHNCVGKGESISV